MADKSSIEWVRGDDGVAGATWNPVTGCSKVTGSPGCQLCYAETFAERWRGVPGHHFERGFDVQERPGQLGLPLTWRRPKRIFVNSMSDLLHKEVDDAFIARVFAVMSQAPQHTFLILTRRPGRMRSLMTGERWPHLVSRAAAADHRELTPFTLPLPNVLLGVSAEDQRWADVRIPVLLDTPAAARFVSAEPLLGPLQLSPWLTGPAGSRLDWVIAGGEFGHGARPMHPAWARGLLDECTAAGVPYFLKQWGSWRLVTEEDPAGADLGADYPSRPRYRVSQNGQVGNLSEWRAGDAVMMRLRPSASGRSLDGQSYADLPQVSPS